MRDAAHQPRHGKEADVRDGTQGSIFRDHDVVFKRKQVVVRGRGRKRERGSIERVHDALDIPLTVSFWRRTGPKKHFAEREKVRIFPDGNGILGIDVHFSLSVRHTCDTVGVCDEFHVHFPAGKRRKCEITGGEKFRPFSDADICVQLFDEEIGRTDRHADHSSGIQIVGVESVESILCKDGKVTVSPRLTGGDHCGGADVYLCFDLREELVSRTRRDVDEAAGCEVGVSVIPFLEDVCEGVELNFGGQDPDIAKVLNGIRADLDVVSRSAAVHQSAAEGIVGKIERPFRVCFQKDPRRLQIVGGLREELHRVFRQRDLCRRDPRRLHDAGRGVYAASRTALKDRQEITVRLREETDLVCRKPRICSERDLCIDCEIVFRLHDADRQDPAAAPRRLHVRVRGRSGQEEDLSRPQLIRSVRLEVQIVLNEDPCIMCSGEVDFCRVCTSQKLPAAGRCVSEQRILERLRIERDRITADLHAVPQRDLRRHVVLHDRARHSDAHADPGIDAERLDVRIRFRFRLDAHAVFRFRGLAVIFRFQSRAIVFQFRTCRECVRFQISSLDLRSVRQNHFRGRTVFEVRLIADAGSCIYGDSPRGNIMAGVCGRIHQDASALRQKTDGLISLDHGGEGIVDERNDPGRGDPGR